MKKCYLSAVKRSKTVLWLLSALSAVLLSIPWLVPRMGVFSLFGFVPLLCAEYVASRDRVRRFWPWHYFTFVLWNALTTFWVCNATVAGGIFAVLANALQMSLVFGLFRLAKKRIGGILSYAFLAFAWVSWEHWYLATSGPSWPWLVLGNAFATTTQYVQWYSITGTLGGSLWIWAVNLGLFGLLVSSTDGIRMRRRKKSSWFETAALLAVTLLPPVCSGIMYDSYEERSESRVEVLVGQPNIDPYSKFTSMTQAEQTEALLGLLEETMALHHADLLIAPETFTSDVVLNDIGASPTVRRFVSFLQDGHSADLLFGAATNEFFATMAPPDLLSYPYGNGWRKARNSAILLSPDGRTEVFHKSKLVPGVELTPWPKLFVPIDDWLSKRINGGHPLMARDSGQEEVSLLHLSDGTPFGCAVCYESVFGEYCASYAAKGASFIAVITNDSWWGDTPGYKQHMSYSALRAIELRRDIVRCGNSGISCFIDQRGDILQRGPWWESAVLYGTVNTNTEQSFFTRYGDIAGRVSVLSFLLLFALVLTRMLLPRK